MGLVGVPGISGHLGRLLLHSSECMPTGNFITSCDALWHPDASVVNAHDDINIVGIIVVE